MTLPQYAVLPQHRCLGNLQAGQSTELEGARKARTGTSPHQASQECSALGNQDVPAYTKHDSAVSIELVVACEMRCSIP